MIRLLLFARVSPVTFIWITDVGNNGAEISQSVTGINTILRNLKWASLWCGSAETPWAMYEAGEFMF